MAETRFALESVNGRTRIGWRNKDGAHMIEVNKKIVSVGCLAALGLCTIAQCICVSGIAQQIINLK